MSNKEFTVSDVLRYSWDAAKSNVILFAMVLIIAAIVIYGSLALILFVLGAFGMIAPENSMLGSIFLLAWFPLEIIVCMGLLKISIKVVDGEEVLLSDLFSTYKCFFSSIIAGIIYGIITEIGFFLLVIPGVIWYCKYFFAYYEVVDKSVGPVEAIQRSGRITDGSKLKIFWFINATMLLNMIGILCLGIGLFITIPMTMIGFAYIYRQLEPGTEPELAVSVEPASPDPLLDARPQPTLETVREPALDARPRPTATAEPMLDARPRPTATVGPEIEPMLDARPRPSAEPAHEPILESKPRQYPEPAQGQAFDPSMKPMPASKPEPAV